MAVLPLAPLIIVAQLLPSQNLVGRLVDYGLRLVSLPLSSLVRRPVPRIRDSRSPAPGVPD